MRNKIILLMKMRDQSPRSEHSFMRSGELPAQKIVPDHFFAAAFRLQVIRARIVAIIGLADVLSRSQLQADLTALGDVIEYVIHNEVSSTALMQPEPV